MGAIGIHNHVAVTRAVRTDGKSQLYSAPLCIGFERFSMRWHAINASSLENFIEKVLT
jgi:hypothetical protein